ncbi:MAG: glycosyl hydrolase family 28 protein [Phycisphaerales bacterium]
MRLLLATVALLGLGIAPVVQGAVEIYPGPEGVKPATNYRVQVDGQEVFVHDSPVGVIASFSFWGTVEVAITPKQDVKAVDVRPRSWGIQPTRTDNVIRFSLSQPGNFSIEINHDLKRPLFLFANPPERNPPRPDEAGVRYFEAGKVHTPGVIELRDNETVYIAGGAVVQGAILARGARNVKICGRGILDGSTMRELVKSGSQRFVHLEGCTGVSLEGVILRNSLAWQIVPIRSDDIDIANVKIVSGNNSDDGIDLVRSRNVRIRDCFIRTKDDCVAIKATGDNFSTGTRNVEVSNCVFWNAEWGNALEIGFELRTDEVRDITFTDCDVIHVEDGAVFSIHNGDSATVRDVRFENIRVEDARQKLIDLAIVLSQYSLDRPTDAQDLQRRYMDGAWDGVLTVSEEQKQEHSKYRGHIRDIVFKDISVIDGLFPFSIVCGFDDRHRIENVTIDGLWIQGVEITSADQGRFYIENADEVVFRQ